MSLSPCPACRPSGILAVDVHYRGDRAVAAGVLFREWEDAEPVAEWTAAIPEVAAYEPGQFCRRSSIPN